MKVVEEILKWADTLPNWQSDAVRRIWIKDVLSAKDADELYQLLKEEVGSGVKGSKPAINPVRFSKSDIGSSTVHGECVTLLSMQNLENVNAIPSTERLIFGDHGLTVIYGDNSAGKSGYSRVLKKSCRARGTAEPIYPNIYENQVGDGTPKATFTVKVENNAPSSIQWEDGQTAPESLGNIAVFDSNAARVYVDDANEVSYIPYGLDVFTKMAAVCRSFRTKIQSEIDSLPKISDTVTKLVGPEHVIKVLTATTTVEDIDKLAPLTKGDEDRLLELTKMIANYRANDPMKKGQELRRQKARIDNLRRVLLATANALSTPAVALFENSSQEAASANEAAKIASEKTFSREPLKGTGSIVWRQMFDSAKKFSEQHAYAGKQFPVIDDDSLCVLCQQSLGDAAKDRMIRFWQFIEADTAKIAKEKAQVFRTKAEKYLHLDINPFDKNAQLLEEIQELSPETARSLMAWLTRQKDRLTQILEAIRTNSWTNISPAERYPSEQLSRLSKRCEAEAEKVEELADPESQKKAEGELAALKYKQDVQANKGAMLQWIDKLKREAKLREALKAVDTTQISKKGSALMEQALTQELENALNREFAALGVEHLTLKFQRTASIGSTYHQLQLQCNTESKVILSDILSEGEHRVVAIASFFAELSTSSHKCGIVFDDPVSSLDHYYRTRVAGRLALEGRDRQVIVFTHDIVFLLELERQANEASVPIALRTVYRTDRSAGLCDPELPWHAMDTKSRIGYLRKMLQEIESLYKRKRMRKYQSEFPRYFGLLREVWERAVEEVLLNKSVERFRQGIEPQRLKSVIIEDQDYVDIDEGVATCSKWLLGHDQAAAVGTTIPTPQDMKESLDKLEAFRSRVNARMEQVRKRRSPGKVK